jgi:hypothetical protein
MKRFNFREQLSTSEHGARPASEAYVLKYHQTERVCGQFYEMNAIIRQYTHPFKIQLNTQQPQGG